MSKKIKKFKKKFTRKGPQNLTQLFNDAIEFQKANQLDKAEALYKKILAKDAQHAKALNFLGLVFQQKGRYDTALKYALGAVQQKKEAGFYCNLGSAYRGCGNLANAVTAFGRALKLKPDLLEAQYNLGLSFLDLGESKKAENIFRKIVLLHPRMLEAHEGLRQSLQTQGDFGGAISAAEQILRLAPQDINAQINKATALLNLNKDTEARNLLETVLKNDPSNALSLNLIGNILGRQGHIHESLSYYQKAAISCPDFIAANTNLAWTYLQHGMLQESINCYKKLLAYHPNSLEIYSDLLFSLNYDPSLEPKQLFAAAHQWWHKYKKLHPKSHSPNPQKKDSFLPPPPIVTEKPGTETPSKKTPQSARSDNTRLRLGFISPDFCKHPVGTFIAPLLTELHSHDIEIFCYAELHPDNYDEVTSNIMTHTHHWYVTKGKTDAEISQQIVSDKIEVLIDLAGHSANNRLAVLAKKPAPTQVSWLGYVNTTGIPLMDYRFTDAIADPPGSSAFQSETLIRLPHGFFCYSPPSDAPEVTQTPFLMKGHITFGSFNNLVKISETVIETWADILLKTTKSKLIMVSRPLTDKYIRDRFRNIFARYAIDPDRIEMHGHLPTSEYLAMHNKIDIALDPFPHNGHTVTCNTLWMGVPVISLCGNRYASRMGSSILQRISLLELVAKDREEYVTKATTLASDIEGLSRLRSTLRQRMLASPMCNSKQFSRDFRHALQKITNDKHQR